MNRRRLAFVFLTIPFAVYAWACSSDSSETPAGNDAGTTPTSTTPTPNPPPPTDPPPNPPPPPPPSDGGDAGNDAGPVTCVGNPLTFDGGTPDGGALIDAAAATMILNEGNGSFADGPQFYDYNGGALVFSQLYSNPPSLVRIQPDGGARTVIRGTANGNQFLIGNAVRDGGLLSTLSVVTPGNNGDAGIVTSNPAIVNNDGGIVGIGAGNNPNDLAVGPKGDLYITDPQYQNNNAGTLAIYRVAPNGTVTQTTSTDRVNGIALSLDASKLFVSATNTKKVYSYPIAADGSITNTPTTLVSATADEPDGMAIDVGGNLWIAESATNGGQSGRVEVFSPAGAKLGEIPFPTQRPTGVAFGGADNKTLFVTVEKGIYVFSSRCAGVR